ncbi:MAG: gliding motility-associated C-terminal domain-containing protein [Bacteroidota bacterium]|nr:gliding motility-associated C-terminal domain-containing protein [Bacteroidota bacterium]
MRNLKVIYFTVLSFFLSYTQIAQVNCSLTTTPASASIICGQSVQLNATGAGGAILMNNDFNTGSAGTGWSVSAAAQFNNPCGPSPDGTAHMWMGNTTAAPRTMTTIGYNIGCTGTICFDLVFASTFSSPCEEPDLSTEGVDVQYSTDGGTTWTSINYFDPLTGLYDVWANYCFAIPAGAVSPNTMFRWLQTGSSGNDYDHWGIDNVNITLTGVCATPAPYYYSWVPTTGLNNPNIANPIATPLTSTTYTLYFTNGIDDTCSAVIPVNVTVPVADAGTMQTICSGQSATLNGTGNTFLPGTSTFNSTTTTAITDNVTVTNAITVSGLPYSTISTTSIAQVCFDITHTFDGDLDIFLRCPSGILLELTTDNGGGGDDFTNTCFTPTAVTNVTTGTAPFTGTYIPEGAGGLGALNGCTANGSWTLRVSDDAGGDIGTINSWSISFVVPPPINATWSPTTNMTGSTTLTPTVTPVATTQYTLTVTGNPGCSASDTVTVQVTTPSAITINNPAPICLGDSTTLTASPLVAGAVYTWQPGGVTGQSITVNPATTTTYSCSYTLGSCTSAVVTSTVTVVNASVISANSPTICIGGSAVINASGSTSYTWSPATGLSATTGASVTANPTVTTVYTITETTSGCNGTTTVTVTVNDLPIIDAGLNDTICDGSSSTLNASGGLTYVWTPDPTLSDSTIASPIATPNTTTTYVVRGTDANGCFATDNVTIVVNPIPVTPTINTPPAICPGNMAVLTATPFVAGAIYTWQPGNIDGQSISVSPLSTTVYSCSYSVNGCVSPSNSVTVTVNNAAIISVPSAAICIGNSTTLTATGATSYTWSPATGLSATTGANVTANPTVTTVYTIVETGSGCNGLTTTTVTVNSLPVVDAGINDTVCLGSFTSLTAIGALTYLWTADPTLNGSTSATPTVTPTISTTYIVTGTDANGCSATDNVTIVVPPTFTVTALQDSASCFGSADGSVTITVNPAVSSFAPYTFLWSNGASTQNIFSVIAGTYNVTVSDISTCSQTVIATVLQPAAPVSIVSVSNNPVTCNGGGDGNISVSASGGTPSYLFSLNGGVFASPTSFSGLSAGTHSVIAQDVNGCASGLLTLTVTEPQVVHVVPPSVTSMTICIGQNATLSASATGGSGGYTYIWNDGINPPVTSSSAITVSPTTGPINYTVTALDVMNCASDNQEIITVSLNTPLIMHAITPATDKICETKDIVVNVSGEGGNSVLTYIWAPNTGVNLLNPDGSSVRLSPLSSTVYTVTVQDGCSTPTASTTYSLTVNPTPSLTITPASTSGCAPLLVQFTGSSTPASAQCNWNFGGNGSSTSCNTSSNFALDGSYNVIYSVVDINGCTNSKTAVVNVFPIPEAMFAASPQPTTVIDPVITFTDITQANIESHTWIFNDSVGTNSTLEVASYTYAAAGTYSVTLAVVTDKGCVDTTTQNVLIDEEYVVYVPNSFTPDGDGINEEFVATGIGITALEMTVYDRWGGVIFDSAEIDKGWNGKDSKEKHVEKGVYIYKLVVTNFLGEKKLVSGHVTLVR